MPNITASDFAAIETAIYNQLVADMNPAGGRISNVRSVGNAWLNEISVFPYVGIQFGSFTQKEYTQRKRTQVYSYLVWAAYRSTISLADANKHLYLLLDDGAGNGVLSILNDPSFFTVNQLAQRGAVTEMKLYDNLSDKASSPNVFVAYAVMRYEVTGFSYASGLVA